MATVTIASSTTIKQTLEPYRKISFFDIVQNASSRKFTYRFSIIQEAEKTNISLVFRRTFG